MSHSLNCDAFIFIYIYIRIRLPPLRNPMRPPTWQTVINFSPLHPVTVCAILHPLLYYIPPTAIHLPFICVRTDYAYRWVVRSDRLTANHQWDYILDHVFFFYYLFFFLISIDCIFFFFAQHETTFYHMNMVIYIQRTERKNKWKIKIFYWNNI